MTKIRLLAIASMMTASTAWADDKQQPTPTAPTVPAMPATPATPTMPTQPATTIPQSAPVNTASTLTPVGGETTSTTKTADAEKKDAKAKKKEPGRGDFDAGGQVRLPNGPDEDGKYATFNWVAVDMKAKYFLLDQVTFSGNVPLAIIHPKSVMGGPETSMFGGISGTLDAKLPKMPKMPFVKYDTEVGLTLTVAYMREGAVLLSEKDFPMFTGDFKPGFLGGLVTKVKLSSLVDFKLTPTWAYQSGTMESLQAVQLPMSLVLKLGDAVKVAADAGVYTGDDYTFSGSGGGRIALGGSLDVKIGKIIAHGGVGAASLLTGGLYPTVKDSLYIDLNVKFAK